MPASGSEPAIDLPPFMSPRRVVGAGQLAEISGANSAAESNIPVRDEQVDRMVLAAALEFQSALDQVDDVQSAATQAVSMLVTALPAQRVILLWRSKQATNLRVLADTNPAVDVENRAELRMVVAAGEEVATRGSLAIWPSDSTNVTSNRHALMAVAQLARHLNAQRLVGIDLVARDGQSKGTVLVIDSDEATTRVFLATVAIPLAGKLVSLERLQPNSVESAFRSMTGILSDKFRVVIGLLVLLSCGMLVPVRYRVHAPLQLRPVGRRFVAVPFDGPLKSSFLRPGDAVRSGDVVATIDPREIDYELAGVQVELNRAQQDRKGRLAAHEFAETKIADLESERLRLQRDLLQVRRDNLAIRSPIDGVIVSGDWKESEGTPMTRGETLFEIAALGKMIVEIEVDETDIAHVRPGMSVDFHVDAFPNRDLTGVLERIHPRALQRNRNHVFVAEVRLLDPDRVLRPGMRGRAVILSDRHPLAWNLFHKAFFAVRQTVGL